MGKKNKKRRRLNNPDRKASSDQRGKESLNGVDDSSCRTGDASGAKEATKHENNNVPPETAANEGSHSPKTKNSSSNRGKKRKRNGHKAKAIEGTVVLPVT